MKKRNSSKTILAPISPKRSVSFVFSSEKQHLMKELLPIIKASSMLTQHTEVMNVAMWKKGQLSKSLFS